MLDRLVIGTAAWAQEYNGHKVSEKEQNLIMEYMKEVGIEWLDVATDYGTEMTGIDDFKRIIKVNAKDTIERIKELLSLQPKGTDVSNLVISHHPEFAEDFRKISGFHRTAADSLEEVDYECVVVEIPYSLMDRRAMSANCCNAFPPKIFARSIFCKGKALKYFSPRECIDFVLMNPRIDKVIIGIDSVDQLKENIAHLVKMEKFEHNEEVDTRKF